jgi:hypothetical protein
MNTANLQIEGILTAMAALTQALRQKGLLTQAEIDDALNAAGQSVAEEREHRTELRPAQLEAIQFPIRFLKIANNLASDGPLAFGRIAAMVDEEKDREAGD